MKINYYQLREKYNDDELVEYLYNYYYYIADKIYKRNDKKISIDIIENGLREIVANYVLKGSKNLCPSSYIHNAFVCFEKTYLHKEKKSKEFELIKRAYAGDVSARQEIFLSYIDRIDKKAYNIYVNNRETILYTLDDIKQVMYLSMWMYTNKFFNKDNDGNYFSVKFDTTLDNICDSICNMIDKANYNSPSNIDNVIYSDTYFIKSIENKEILDDISYILRDKEKTILEYLRQGYSYEYAAAQVGDKRQNVTRMNNKIKKHVKKHNIEW